MDMVVMVVVVYEGGDAWTKVGGGGDGETGKEGACGGDSGGRKMIMGV